MEAEGNSNGLIVWKNHNTEIGSAGSSDVGGAIYVATADDTKKQWDEFVNGFKTQRFFISEDETLLKNHVSQIIHDNLHAISKGKKFVRARINNEGKDFSKNKELAAPPEHLVGTGRLNQRGIRYLYVADIAKTAVAELRPWINAVITVADVKAKRNLKVIDFVPKDTDNESSFKRIIGELFSRPVRPDISDIEYLPTQCIAEFVKRNGYDGVRYASAVNPGGINYCLFDPDCVSVKISHKVLVTTINVESKQI
ncbi:RES family NAD+ phosphorylase [Brevibacillus sp. M2.1A]|uniref:RES family NAD+ phosphorylase n=1 Tax=Brevibacillus sp. M2.1A TaxID=2738980 RepID=UPI00156B82A1|nr:RES family NAD+ phosphorylase [Brevibacillus sp. M2.1A]MCC8433455.1 RES family NAD+ phosphorylase [Brevibacillus sp. M2.1A]